MHVKIKRSISVLSLIACLSLVAFLFINATISTAAPAFTTVANSTEPWTASAQKMSHHNPDDQLTVGLLLKTSHPDQQQALLQSLSNPKSAQYHQWLTATDFASRFAPAAADVTAAKNFLTSEGLKVQPDSNGGLLLASGTTTQIETALHTQINDYRLGNAIHYSNSTDVQVPASLSLSTVGVFGLSDLAPMSNGVVPDGPAQQALPYGGGPNGSGLTPSQINGIYDATPVNKKLYDKGQGQTLAVYELSGYKRADIRVYEQQFGLPDVNIVDKNVLGGPIAIQGSKDSGASEVELDIELQIAAAPEAKKVLVYNAPNTELGALAEYQKIVQDNSADVVSSSWALACEFGVSSQSTLAENQFFLQAAIQGQSLFIASGDSGAFGCARAGITLPPDQALQIGDPNNQPYVTIVGGTSFRAEGAGAKGHGAVLFDPGTNPNPAYPGTSKEVVWNQGCTAQQTDCGTFGAAGGGVSRIWAEPDYAANLTTGAFLPGVAEQAFSQTGAYCNQQPGVLCRQSPDVSLDADPATGYAVFCTDPGDPLCVTGDLGTPGWLRIGGTSCAAPIYSGFVALANQYHKGRIGLFNYPVYQFDSPAGYASQLHDITTGDNGHYPAGPNYDMATGLGTPDVYNLVAAL